MYRDVWNGLATCKVYINAKSFKGDIYVKPTTKQGQKSRVFGNYVDEIYKNRPQTGVTVSNPAYWTSRWQGHVYVEPIATGDMSDPGSMSQASAVLVDWDRYETAGLSYPKPPNPPLSTLSSKHIS